MTSIEWTDATWNPIVGCSRVSRGCERCYAERTAHRGMAPQHTGLTVLGQHGPRWTGEVRLVEDRLALPLTWKKPRRVFVNSMSDLFHEALSIHTIARVFAVMAASPQHTFQVLTKRPARMRDLLRSDLLWNGVDSALGSEPLRGRDDLGPAYDMVFEKCLPNVWLGVTAEDQATADERIPLLLDTPAALRFVSYEPALGPVRFDRLETVGGDAWLNSLTGRWSGNDARWTRLDWIIVGGESGPGARPFDIGWAQATIVQCRAAGVPCFVKQLGGHPFYRTPIAPTAPADDRLRIVLKDRKGGDWDEWDEDLRVREFPTVRS